MQALVQPQHDGLARVAMQSLLQFRIAPYVWACKELTSSPEGFFDLSMHISFFVENGTKSHKVSENCEGRHVLLARRIPGSVSCIRFVAS